ncbi:hypothetical protein, partial [Thermoactinomyces intermedius]|uniref:hypothetical protein n=1 Tax=Thermoactinomyces intermedius TaxID=2024 RepID=UPI001C68778C
YRKVGMDHLLSKELISSKNDFFKESCLTLFGFEGIRENLCYQKMTEVFVFSFAGKEIPFKINK